MNDSLQLLDKLLAFNAHLNALALAPIDTEPLKDWVYSLVMFGMTAPQRQALEQHIGTIMQAMVIALLGWSLSTTVQMNRELGEFKSTIVALQSNLNNATVDRYRASDAARDHAAIWADIQRADQRLKDLTEAFNKHKSEVVGLSGVEYNSATKNGIRR